MARSAIAETRFVSRLGPEERARYLKSKSRQLDSSDPDPKVRHAIPGGRGGTRPSDYLNMKNSSPPVRRPYLHQAQAPATFSHR